MSGDLIDTTEMYLKTVFELDEAGIVPMRARIAERIGHSSPTVSQTVARMERDGLVHLDAERRIHLTDEGAAMAMDVMRKHRLAERHLLDQIGLDYAMVHEEACRWEHVMSTEVERRIAAQITPPYVDPYGNPIPGLADLGIDVDSAGHDERAPGDGDLALLSDLVPAGAGGGSVDVVLERIGERAQSDVPLLRDLVDLGLLPGARFRAERIGENVRLIAEDRRELVLDADAAGQLVVTPGV